MRPQAGGRGRSARHIGLIITKRFSERQDLAATSSTPPASTGPMWRGVRAATGQIPGPWRGELLPDTDQVDTERLGGRWDGLDAGALNRPSCRRPAVSVDPRAWRP